MLIALGKNFEASPLFIIISLTMVELTGVCSGDVSINTVSISGAK